MSSTTAAWPLISLKQILKPISLPVPVEPLKTYSLLGMHWYAQGLYIKEQKQGSQIQATTLYQVKEGDFVYNRLFAWKGSFGIAAADTADCYVSNEFPCFRVDETRAFPAFLLKYFSQTRIWQDAQESSSGTTPTSRLRLKEEQLLAMEIPLPPLDEQRRIVARIDALAAKLEEARGLRRGAVEETETLVDVSRARIFKEALEGATARLDSIATLERGRFSHRPRNDPYFFGGEHPWIQIAEIESSGKYIEHWSQTLNEEGLAISRKFPKGTILVSIAATIGAIGILDFDCCIPDSIVAITPKPNIDSSYVYHYLGYLRSHLEQAASQSAQKNINLEVLSPLPIPDVPLEEQRRIVGYLDELEVKADALKQLQAEAAAELEALLPSVLDQAFRGGL